MSNIVFARPDAFYLFLGLIPLIGWYIFRQKRSQASIQISSLEGLKHVGKTWKHYLRHVVFLIQLIVMSLIIACLARPQSSDNWQNQTVEGIDIIIALDISSSMLARDFHPDRIEA